MQFNSIDGQTQTTLSADGKVLNPLPFTLSSRRLRLLVPELAGFSGVLHQLFVRLGKQFDDLGMIRLALSSGEPAPAIVMCTSPLRVAVRATAMDSIVILDFPTSLNRSYGLRIGSRLLSVNNYLGPGPLDGDLTFGPRRNPLWTTVIPLVVDFLCDETEAIQRCKSAIPEPEWQALYRVAQQIVANPLGSRYRDGRPHMASQPLAEALAYDANLRSAQRARKILLSVLAALIVVPTLSCAGIYSLIQRRDNRRTIAVVPPTIPPEVRRNLPVNARPNLPATAPPAIPVPEPPPGMARPQKSTTTGIPRHDSTSPDFFLEAKQEAERLRKQSEEEFQKHLNRARIQPLESGMPLDRANGTDVTDATPLSPGDRVFASWGGRWWNATVLKVGASDVTIKYDGWAGNETVSRRNLRAPAKPK